MQVIDAAMSRSRTVVLGLITVLVAGILAYVTVPKEAEPDIEIPIIYVYIEHIGISPEDAERLLVRPMEQELRSIEGIKEMIAGVHEALADRNDRCRVGEACEPHAVTRRQCDIGDDELDFAALINNFEADIAGVIERQQ